VPYKKPEIEKFLFTVGEVADIFQVNPSLIRYWESQFDILKPQKNKKGNRLFTKDDVENFKIIYHLVKERKLTLSGVKLKLRQNREETVNNFEIVKLLQGVRKQLVELRETLENKYAEH
jgi:DNA-binding transcriptional MerR regulator